MARYHVGDTVIVHGRTGKIVWLSENPSEIEAMDEYIIEFDDKQRRFLIASELEASRVLCR
jgi:hypothetical protein